MIQVPLVQAPRAIDPWCTLTDRKTDRQKRAKAPIKTVMPYYRVTYTTA